ncbi:DUF350 domain-containing protein [Erwiniaceae bacterium CAU 1747]
MVTGKGCVRVNGGRKGKESGLLTLTAVRLFIRDISRRHDISRRIEENQHAFGLFFGGISTGVGILNAACMTN